MDAGLFIILLALIVTAVHIFDKISDFIIYKPRHVKKDKSKDEEFWGDKDE